MPATEQEVREIVMRASIGLLERIGTGGTVDARVLGALSPRARAVFTQEREANGQFGPGDGSEAGGGGKSGGYSGTYAGEGKDGFVSREQYEKAYGQAQDKIEACPRPSQEQIDKNREMIAGSKRAGGDFRGSSYQRRNNTGKLLNEFGNGEKAPCVWCGRELEASTLTQDKIFTGHEGGRYTYANLLPACLGCNQSRGAASITASAFAVRAKEGAIVTAAPLGWTEAQANNTEDEQDVSLPTLDDHPGMLTGKLTIVHVHVPAASIDYRKYIIGGVDVDPATLAEPSQGPPANLDDLLSRTASGAPSRRVARAESRRLVDIDRDLRARLHTAANAAMKRTLERAGAKVVSKSRTASGAALRPFVAGPTYLIPRRTPQALLASLGLDEHVLLQTAWDDLRDQFDRWVKDAQCASARTAARIVKKSGDEACRQLRNAHDVAREQAWNQLQRSLNAQASEIISDTDPEREINADGLVPVGSIRTAMALAGGISAVSAGLGTSGVPVSSDEVMGQIGTGGIVETYLLANGADTEEYEWVHGVSDQPFPAHEDLDGVVFTNFDDDVLAADGGFPDTEYLHPGDHPGCSCDFVRHWATGSGDAPDDTADEQAA